MSKDSIDIAIKIEMPFGSIETIEDEEEHLRSLKQTNALFTYVERTMCTCAQCALCFANKQGKNKSDKPGHDNQGSNLLK